MRAKRMFWHGQRQMRDFVGVENGEISDLMELDGHDASLLLFSSERVPYAHQSSRFTNLLMICFYRQILLVVVTH